MNHVINLEKYKEFLAIANKLNQIGIVPLLLGSLGLELVTRVDWNPSDIDIHVPGDPRGWTALDEERIYDWDAITLVMYDLGYKLIDLHEHEFEKNGLLVEFGVIDTLPEFAGVRLEDIKVEEDQATAYYLLDCVQYLNVYLASSRDGYRNEKNNCKDFNKIAYLKTVIEQKQALNEQNTKTIIRLAKPADAFDLAQIHMRSWEVAYKDIIPMNYIQEKNRTRVALFERVITNDNTTTFIILYHGKSAGLMTVAPPKDEDLSDEFYEVHGLYLHPDYFRRGLGTQAINFACNLASSIDKKLMTVWVLKDNLKSIAFYQKCGFVADGKVKNVEYGKTLQCIRMRMIL